MVFLYVFGNILLPVRVLLSWSLPSVCPVPSSLLRASPLLMTDIPWGPARILCDSGASRGSGRSLGWESSDLDLNPGVTSNLSGDIRQGLALQ